MLVNAHMPENVANQLWKNRMITWFILLPSCVMLLLFGLYNMNPVANQILYPIPNLLLGFISIIIGIACGCHSIYLIKEEHRILFSY